VSQDRADEALAATRRDRRRRRVVRRGHHPGQPPLRV